MTHSTRHELHAEVRRQRDACGGGKTISAALGGGMPPTARADKWARGEAKVLSPICRWPQVLRTRAAPGTPADPLT